EAARACRSKSPLLVNLGALAHMNRDFTEHVLLVFGQNQIIPCRGRLDPLRQIVELRPRLRPADLPQRSFQISGILLPPPRVGASAPNRARIEIELRPQTFHTSVQTRRRFAENAFPDFLLFLSRRFTNVESQHRSPQREAPDPPAQNQHATDFFAQARDGALALRVVGIGVVAFNEQATTAHYRFALPKFDERIKLGWMRRHRMSRDRVQMETELRAGRGSNVAFTLRLIAAQLNGRQHRFARRRPDAHDCLNQSLVRRRQFAGDRDPLEQSAQTIVQVIYTGEIMQYPL